LLKFKLPYSFSFAVREAQLRGYDPQMLNGLMILFFLRRKRVYNMNDDLGDFFSREFI